MKDKTERIEIKDPNEGRLHLRYTPRTLDELLEANPHPNLQENAEPNRIKCKTSFGSTAHNGSTSP